MPFLQSIWKCITLCLLTVAFEQYVIRADARPCNNGWFGDSCEYKCHCVSPNLCSSSGDCIDGHCSVGWFGIKCQYLDLVQEASSLEPNRSQLTEGNIVRCTILEQIKVTWGKHQDLDWIRILLENKKFESFTLVFNSDNGIVDSTYQFHNASDERTVDIHFKLTNLSNSIEISLDEERSVCAVFVSGGRNIALKQETQHASTMRNYESDKAVDGNRNADMMQGSCTHTLRHNASYWNIRFKRRVSIQRFIIVNRDAERQRLKGFLLEAFSSDQRLPVYHFNDQSGENNVPIYDWTTRSFTADNLTITSGISDGSLTLCEVEIYGEYVCDFRHYGLNCEMPCICQDPKAFCASSTGACSETKCGTLPTIANGKWMLCLNKICHLKCEKGHKIEGNETIRCQDIQQWTVPGSCINAKAENGCYEGWYGPNCYYRDIMLFGQEIYPLSLLDNDTCAVTDSLHMKFKSETYFISIIIFLKEESNFSATVFSAFSNGSEYECQPTINHWIDTHTAELECKTKSFVTETKILFNLETTVCQVRLNGGRNILKESKVSIRLDGIETNEILPEDDMQDNCLIINKTGQLISFVSKFDWPREVYQIVIYTTGMWNTFMTGFVVQIFNDENEVVFSRTINTISLFYEINVDTSGPIMKIVLSTTGFLSLCEMQAYGATNTIKFETNSSKPDEDGILFSKSMKRLMSRNEISAIVLVLVLVIFFISILCFMQCYTKNSKPQEE